MTLAEVLQLVIAIGTVAGLFYRIGKDIGNKKK